MHLFPIAFALAFCVFPSSSISATVTESAVSPLRSPSVPPGFVTAVGDKFVLDGKPFVRHMCVVLSSMRNLLNRFAVQSFVGANSYVRCTGLTAFS